MDGKIASKTIRIRYETDDEIIEMKSLRKIFFIELGTFLFALAVGMFLLPGEILTGGVAGIVTLLHPYVSVSEDVLVSIISTVLFAVGCIFLGRDFIVNTVIHSISYPVMLMIVSRMIPVFEIDPILAAIYGGVLGGIGIGIVFRQGGSTGGMDVPPLIIEKYTNFKASQCIMVFDSITVLAGLYFKGLNSVLIGLISVYFTTMTMEKTIELYGGIEANKFEIISDRHEEISKEIHVRLNRGTTLVDAEGGYTHESKKMLMVVVSDEQFSIVKEIIERIDPNAFVIVSETKDVNGEGFTYEPRI